jgi:hypothetical protein
VRVLRFRNCEIEQNPSDVLRQILNAIHSPSPGRRACEQERGTGGEAGLRAGACGGG